MLKLQQFYIIKLDSARLKEHNFKIKELPIERARLNGELVQISNSQLVRTIYEVKNKPFSQYDLDSLLEERDYLKKKRNGRGNRERILKLNKEIDDMLFIPELVSIEFSDRRHFLNILRKGGFFVNNKKYVPFMSSAGQIRRSSSLFIDSELKEKLDTIFNNGRNFEKEIVPAKFSAYFALYSSSSFPVSFPRIAVVSDLILKTIRRVDYSKYVDEKTDPIIEEQEMEIEANAFDGSGLMTPQYAGQIAKDLDMDYIPSSAIIRAPFMKGLLVTFDLYDFARNVAEKDFLTDIYGNKVNIHEVDCVISQSMFKLWDSYSSTEQYVSNCFSNNLSFGVSKLSPKEDKNHCRSSYQFLQVLNLDEKDVEEICKPTLEWIDSVAGGDLSRSLLFSLGETKFDKGWFSKVEPVVQALLLENSLINDKYVINHFERAVAKKKNDAKIGRLVFSGNYSTMIADPYLQACHIFGIELKPLLNDGEHYSSYWLERDVGQVIGIRSPIVHSSEVNVLNLKNSEELKYWYKWLKSGIVFPANGIGIDCAINGGADYL